MGTSGKGSAFVLVWGHRDKAKRVRFKRSSQGAAIAPISLELQTIQCKYFAEVDTTTAEIHHLPGKTGSKRRKPIRVRI